MLDITKRPRTIDGYRDIIVNHLPEFCVEKAFIPRYGLDFYAVGKMAHMVRILFEWKQL